MDAVRGPLRDIPPTSIEVRGSRGTPYNPQKPLLLPDEQLKRGKKWPHLSPLGRALGIVLIIVGSGVGIFFLASALISESNGGEPPAADTETASAPASTDNVVVEETPTPVEEPAGSVREGVTADDAAAGAAEEAADPIQESLVAPEIITPLDLGGAPVLIERGGATPIPSIESNPTLSNGSPYDPADPALAFSSVWTIGTVLEITRLPGGPLLSAEEAAELVGKTIQVTVVDTGSFPTELQLSPAAYHNLALPIEPIIALRMEVVDAPEGSLAPLAEGDEETAAGSTPEE